MKGGIMTLSELLATATKVELSRGNTVGVCVVCSKETKEGIRIKDTISDNFTGWSYLYQVIVCVLIATISFLIKFSEESLG
jgi:hypothetical protein